MQLVKFSDEKREFELFFFQSILVNNSDKIKRVRVFHITLQKR